jgi:hypothetical protein
MAPLACDGPRARALDCPDLTSLWWGRLVEAGFFVPFSDPFNPSGKFGLVHLLAVWANKRSGQHQRVLLHLRHANHHGSATVAAFIRERA